LNSFLSAVGINPNDTSTIFDVVKYRTFTANFKALPPPIPPDYLAPLYAIIVTSIIGWSIPSIFGWTKARTQRKHLKECINQIGKLDKDAIEKKIIRYYVDGKISEDHRQLLKDKISEYYQSVEGSSGSVGGSSGSPF